jgi:Na+/H+ antiporter NhaA
LRAFSRLVLVLCELAAFLGHTSTPGEAYVVFFNTATALALEEVQGQTTLAQWVFGELIETFSTHSRAKLKS